MILFLNPYWSSNFVKLLAHVYSIVFVALSKPIITCLGCQLDPKKLISKANISCATLDTHKSKLVVVEIQSINFGKKNIYFIFSTKLGNISWENYFLKGRQL
jgi:hypothetical protein